jgi:vitamin B12 transporter
MKKILVAMALFMLAHHDSALAAGGSAGDDEGLFGGVRALAGPVTRALGRVMSLDRIVVSPDRMRESTAMTAGDVAVISRSDFDEKKQKFVKDALANEAGVSKSTTGAFGGQTDIRIRGANPDHTLVLIDGVKAYDPASTNGAFNFANLGFEDVEQIEVLRGAQSSLYGSDAIGGVVTLESRKPNAYFCEAGVESGSFWEITEYVNLGGYVKGLHYSFGFSQFNTQGISAADKRTIPNIEETDPYRRTVFAGRLDYDINPDFTVGATLRNIYARNKYDGSNPITWAMQDNDEITGTSNLFIYSLYVEHRPIEQYDYSVRYSYLDSYRTDFDPPAGMSDWYDGMANRFDFQNNFHIYDFDIVSVGYDYAFERSDSYSYSFASGEVDNPKVFDTNSALFLQNKIFYEDLAGSTQSMRVDHHSQFGTNNTYKVDGFFRAPTGTRARGSWSTSFKAPSLYQLNAPGNAAWGFLGGNPNLSPERARSFEIGGDQYLMGGSVKVSVTYFYTMFTNLIEYVANPATFLSTYLNAAKAKSLGMEYEAEGRFFDGMLKIKANATSTDTYDYQTNRQLLRVPMKQFNINVNVVPVQKLNVNMNVAYTGMQLSSGTDKLKPYTKVDLVVEYALTKQVSVYGRIENLFDEYYEEVRGYGTPGFSAYGGIKAAF